MRELPELRLRDANSRPVRADGEFVLYWMTATRRVRFNFALERAVAHAAGTSKPLVVVEDLPCGHRFATARTHRFALEGMADNARALSRRGVLYYPHVETAQGAGQELVVALASRASVVVTDDHPWPFLARRTAGAADRIPVRVEAVDSIGLLPMRAADRAFPTAHAFRRFLQKVLPEHLGSLPEADPLRGVRLPPAPSLPSGITRRWRAASAARLAGGVSGLPIDHAVPRAPFAGGAAEAGRALTRFVKERLDRYDADRNRPEREATSGLSPYLRFGHVSAHEALSALAVHEGWSPRDVGSRATGSRSGWWGMRACAEAFLDQLVTWRELGYNMAGAREDHDRYESLPAWAQATLARHASDPRRHLYPLEALEAGATHDPLWNAAETQLVREGRIHNYLRMLWGKKILEWSASPREALEAMIELNNRYALDGLDPNSYSGIFWILGRYDRPWGPERPVFGTIRYMSSENTARKLDVRSYIGRFGSGAGPAPRSGRVFGESEP